MLAQVFVPDAPAASPRQETVGTADDVELLRGRASAQVSSASAQELRTAESNQIPDWWNASPALHVSLYYKQEVRCPSITFLLQYLPVWVSVFDPLQ